MSKSYDLANTIVCLVPTNRFAEDAITSRVENRGFVVSDPDYSSEVVRLGFDNTRSKGDFTFANSSLSASYGPDGDRAIVSVAMSGRANEYFKIHYNLKSGALLIMALSKDDVRVKVGNVVLEAGQSLVLMAGAKIRLIQGNVVVALSVEFPDVGEATSKQHEICYRQYAMKIGAHDAVYLLSPRNEYPRMSEGSPYRDLAFLGQGAESYVRKVIHEKTGHAYAVKVVKVQSQNPNHELELLQGLKHDNIIALCDRPFLNKSGQTCVVLELGVNDLDKHIRARKNNGESMSSAGTRGRRVLKPYLPLHAVTAIGQQAMSALTYLHAQNIMHRDLKPQNIIVTSWDRLTDIPTIKLADFGMAKRSLTSMTFVGTYAYLPPEMKEYLESSRDSFVLEYTNAVDVWVLGKILQDLLDDFKSGKQEDDEKLTNIERKVLDCAQILCRSMMSRFASDRPSAKTCSESPWLTETPAAGIKRNTSPSNSTSSFSSSTNESRPQRKSARPNPDNSTISNVSRDQTKGTSTLRNASNVVDEKGDDKSNLRGSSRWNLRVEDGFGNTWVPPGTQKAKPERAADSEYESQSLSGPWEDVIIPVRSIPKQEERSTPRPEQRRAPPRPAGNRVPAEPWYSNNGNPGNREPPRAGSIFHGLTILESVTSDSSL